MNVDLVTATGQAPAPFHPAMVAEPVTFEMRSARIEEAAQIHALVQEHLEEGHLLPRSLDELTVHAGRFVVAVAGDRVVACAELAPLSGRVAEVRSLVVHLDARHEGLGKLLVHELMRRARLDGFDTLCAFTHGPGFFVRLGFSIVPHAWLPEKIETDCRTCAQFRGCGQYAVMLSLIRSRQSCVPLSSLHG